MAYLKCNNKCASYQCDLANECKMNFPAYKTGHVTYGTCRGLCTFSLSPFTTKDCDGKCEELEGFKVKGTFETFIIFHKKPKFRLEPCRFLKITNVSLKKVPNSSQVQTLGLSLFLDIAKLSLNSSLAGLSWSFSQLLQLTTARTTTIGGKSAAIWQSNCQKDSEKVTFGRKFLSFPTISHNMITDLNILLSLSLFC